MTSLDPSNLIDQRLEDTHHFEWYVPPELHWEDPDDQARGAAEGRFVQTWKETPVSGQDQQILIHALKEIIAEDRGRGIVLLAAAGSGKTVLSFMCEHVLTNPSLREQVFSDPLPRLVLRWAKSNWPTPTVPAQTLVDLIVADEVFLKYCADKRIGVDPSTVARMLAQYAVQQGRVAIVIDAWDELEEDQRKSFRQVYLHARSQGERIFLAISSRDYAVNDEADSFFLSDAFRRLRIQPFKTALQDRFMEKALSPSVADWRKKCLEGTGEDWDKQLGIPLVLRQVAVMINGANAQAKSLPKFSSLSDLFLQTFRWMMAREFGPEKNEHSNKNRLNGKRLVLADCYDILERALGAIAFELSIRGIWKEVKGPVRQIGEILESAKQRFERSCQQAYFQGDIQKSWEWARDRFGEFEINNGSLQADINTKVLSFTTRHVQEMRCARYLTHHATDIDLRDFNQPVRCALGHNGDQQWEDIWKGVIKMPIDPNIDDPQKGYMGALEVLFERPIHDDQRRPTKLMWDCDRWIKSQQERVSQLRGLDDRLRVHLRSQFLRILQGEAGESKQQIAEDLIDEKNFVLLADPECKHDAWDTGEFVRQVEDYESEGGYKDHGAVRLTRYQLCKYAISNEQFQLFDGNFNRKDQYDYERFGGANQPAVFVSWFDGYWFSDFVVMKGSSWQVVLPTEAQWEYGARAGGKGDYFRGKGRWRKPEVTTNTLARYAHFDQDWITGKTLAVRGHGKLPNAWGLEMMSGNVWEWCSDWWDDYPAGFATDPVGPEEGFARVYRGGSWRDGAALCRSASRVRFSPSNRFDDFGFRVALSSIGNPQVAGGGQ